MKYFAIIVAGGSGSRFGGDVPKQFRALGGIPVLMRSIKQFASCRVPIEVITVLPAIQVAAWKALCLQYSFDVPHRIVPGGNSRYQSVKNALAVIEPSEGDVVAVHDGVRPMATPALIERVLATARVEGGVVPVVPVVDSVRQVLDDGKSVALERKTLRCVQTPQAFDAVALKEAYEQPYCDAFTDDASVYEAAGGSVTLVEGEALNIKITRPFDLAALELALQQR